MNGEERVQFVYLTFSGFFVLEVVALLVSIWLQQQPWFQRWVTRFYPKEG